MKISRLIKGSSLLLIAIVIGCAPLDSRVTGKWFEIGNKNHSQYVEFFSDKTIALSTQMGTYQGNWSILTDGRIKSDVTILWSKVIILGDLNGNILTLDIGGKKGKFEKN